MSERPTTPDSIDTLHAWFEQYLLGVHTAMPGKIQAYDHTTQRADVQPLVRHPVPQPDGTYTYEDLPTLPGIPVLMPRSGNAFVYVPVSVGDTVLVVFCESAIGPWRAGNGDPQYPGDLERHDLSHGVALLGMFPNNAAIAQPGSGSDLVVGFDGSGTRITIGSSGTVTITQGSNTVALIDGGGTVHLGGTAGTLVALANLVKARLDAIQSTFDAHTHPASSGTTSATLTPIGPLGDVAATKTEAV